MVNKWGREDQERDRGLAVSKNYFVVFDNLSRISNAESDELCLYATGGRKEERKLFTNGARACPFCKRDRFKITKDWSEVRLRHLEYPAIPQYGGEYPY